MSQALALKNGNKSKKVEYVFTDKNFYVVKDNRLGHFTPVLQVEIVGNKKLIDSIKENIKNGSHRKATTIAEWAGIVQSGTRSDNRDNDSITRRETNGYANELYGEESESKAGRNTSQNSRNSKKVVRYDFENRTITYKDGTKVKFSLKDSNGNASKPAIKDSYGNYLTANQVEFFKDTKIRNDDSLLSVWHGTDTQFYTFDKATRGTHTGTPDAKLGFFFTDSYKVAQDYAMSANEFKKFIKKAEIANGDTNKLTNLLSNNYDEVASTEDLEALQALDLNTGNAYVNEFFLNIKNPHVEDWAGKSYHKLAMLKAIEKALKQKNDGVIILNIEDAINLQTISNVYVAFEPNQIKLTTNKNPTKNSDIRFSLKDKADIKQYTEKQYNDFGWARVNGILSANENYDFKKKYLEIKNGTNKDIHKTANGEYIVAVNDMEGKSFAVNNVLVYAKGPYDNYKINKVVKIDLDNETAIELVRDTIYEYETTRRKQTYTASEIVEAYFGEELISEFRLGDFPSYQESKDERQRQFGRDDGFEYNSDNQREFNGRGDFEENQRTIKFSLKDGATYTLSDGQVKKKVANFTKLKVYSKVEAEKIINSILETNFNLEDYSVRISGKTKAEFKKAGVIF